MKTEKLYSMFNTRIYLLFGVIAALLMLSGCGQKEVEVAKLEQEEAFANIPHSHEATEEKCFICDPSQRDKGRLWCAEHARYEDRCWLCHPELEDKSRLWCKEHSLYEDECFLCHPELKMGAESEEKTAPIEGALNSFKKSQLLFCNEHNVAEKECGICQPDLAASLLPGGNMKVRFPSVASADKVGIQTDLPKMSKAVPTIQAFCEVQYNLNTMAKVTPLVGGVISNVMRDLGDEVIAGEALLELHSAEVASVKSDYLSALVDLDIRRQAFDRESRLSIQNIAAEKDLLEAEANFRTAKFSVSKLRQKLTNFGLNEKEVVEVGLEQDTSARLVIRAPFDGTLVERGAVRGEAVEMGQALFTIADLSTNWLTLSIPSDHIGQVRIGQTVAAQFPELPGTTIRGRITWLDTSIDSRSRMVRARAVVTDDAHLIKSGLFGDALITVGEARPAAFVPKNAVQRHEGNDFVFVREEPDLFALRRVALGNSRDGNVEVLLGLNSNDSVVTGGSFIVMSEFLKSRLGAGCVDE